jgi:histidine kinase/DNA gyrase B/HSP90-like ATPase/sodium/hydrogen exchanger family protein
VGARNDRGTPGVQLLEQRDDVALADPDASADTLRVAHERVLVAGVQQERLIDALLVLARGQAGLSAAAPVDLSRTAERVIADRRVEAMSLGVTVRATLTPAPTSGDARLIERLVANLVDNALRHNVDDGDVEVTTRVQNDEVVLAVSNTGPFVPAAEVARLFQPFQRLGADRVGQGAGLGLSIVQAISDAHGATLHTRPRPTGGLYIEVAFARASDGVSEPEIKLLLLLLFALGGLATQAGSEAVLPAYLAGLVIAGAFMHDRILMDRLRSIAFALLTPFFFLRAGTLIHGSALVSGAGVIAVLLAVKLISKGIAVWPTAARFRLERRERAYTTLLMATGLTFGSISALFGLTHQLINSTQYTELVTVVVLSAFVPTLIAQQLFQPELVDADEDKAARRDDPTP